MNNLTTTYTQPYLPLKSLVIYGEKKNGDKHYVESFDFDDNGRMINAHPLTLQESRELGTILMSNEGQKERCFQSSGLIPENVLYTQTGADGYVIWHTPSQKRNLYFINELGIPDAQYSIPPLLWVASREKLKIYALKSDTRPTLVSPLFKAPFFNIHSDGLVCMGTVDIEISAFFDLEDIMLAWHTYFFNSKFSHLLSERSPVKSNIIQLFKALASSRKKFPLTELVKTDEKIKNLINGDI